MKEGEAQKQIEQQMNHTGVLLTIIKYGMKVTIFVRPDFDRLILTPI